MSSDACTAILNYTGPLSQLGKVYDLEVIGSNCSSDVLAQIIKASFEARVTWDEHDAHGDEYQKLIEKAMRLGNLEALDMLWKGMYDNGDHPSYEYDLRTAAAVGTLTTFKFVLHGFQNYAVHHPMEPITVERLIADAEEDENEEVLDFLKRMMETVLYPLPMIGDGRED